MKEGISVDLIYLTTQSTIHITQYIHDPPGSPKIKLKINRALFSTPLKLGCIGEITI